MTFFEKIHASSVDIPLVMGILNVTPDSFSDGGVHNSEDQIKSVLERMQSAGVDIVDIGGESTRPGAATVSLDEELERVLPVIEWVKQMTDMSISIDTYKTEVMKESIKLGVDLINDINALQSKGAEEVVAVSGVMACLMHKKGEPRNMQDNPVYENVFQEVSDFLTLRAKECISNGIKHENILIDPGFGFGKSLEHNVKLFEQLEQFSSLGHPILVGVSRKRMIGDILGGLPVEKRMIGSVSAAIVAAMKGARVIRVHDFEETIQAFKVMRTLL